MLPGNVTRIVVGHTIQPGHITSACDGAAWRIDVGMSRGKCVICICVCVCVCVCV
jgi:hypothetical protein